MKLQLKKKKSNWRNKQTREWLKLSFWDIIILSVCPWTLSLDQISHGNLCLPANTTVNTCTATGASSRVQPDPYYILNPSYLFQTESGQKAASTGHLDLYKRTLMWFSYSEVLGKEETSKEHRQGENIGSPAQTFHYTVEKSLYTVLP